ncbi:MAG: BadF/BadG/BcrA/BcrD ATPase family protein [Caldilineaceae bacterium]
MPTEEVVLGIDGGGTHTRVVCADLAGNILGRAQGGAANPSKNPDAAAAVQQAILEALAAAQRRPQQIAALVAGLAGMDDPADQEWAQRFTTLSGLAVKPICVNDAVVAWAGALTLQPGIVVIAGTGCIVLGVTAAGRQISNYDLGHYANATARNLTYAAVFRILAEATTQSDEPLVTELLAYFAVQDIPSLAEATLGHEQLPRAERIRLYSGCAHLITGAAGQGVPLACAVCDQAATELAEAVRVVGALFDQDTILYACCGSVVRTSYLHQALQRHLDIPRRRCFLHQEPHFSPEIGALLLAYQQIALPLDQARLDQLRQRVV